MKIAYIIPFKYNWDSFSTVKSALETLPSEGIEPILFIKKYDGSIPVDQIWLMGSGTRLSKEEYLNMKVPVIAFGLSDPNLYQQEHFENCDLYCTNSMEIYMKLKDQKTVYWYPTCCDKRYHKNLNLLKTIDVLFIGMGKHKFLPFRNDIVNELRAKGIKIKVFGRGWDKHPDTQGFIDGERLITEINKAKILLDLIDEKTSLSHRIFEGSACGTPVITQYRGDSRLLFKMFEELIPYKKYSDLENTIKYYLEHPEETTLIGKKAQERCEKEHDIIHRVHWLVNFIRNQKLCKKR